MKFAVAVDVMPRTEISDPQGLTIERALPSLGFEGVEGVRVGKRIRFLLEAPDLDAARDLTALACEKVFSNPVIEEFDFEVTPPA